jgi:hypothetical protein
MDAIDFRTVDLNLHESGRKVHPDLAGAAIATDSERKPGIGRKTADWQLYWSMPKSVGELGFTGCQPIWTAISPKGNSVFLPKF